METLYRKEQILNIVDRCFKMHACDFRNDARMAATEMIEEIETIRTDNTQTLANALQQIEKLEAEKREVIEMCETLMGHLKEEQGYESAITSAAFHLIQKIKQ